MNKFNEFYESVLKETVSGPIPTKDHYSISKSRTWKKETDDGYVRITHFTPDGSKGAYYKTNSDYPSNNVREIIELIKSFIRDEITLEIDVDLVLTVFKEDKYFKDLKINIKYLKQFAKKIR